jgi:hypothetical protein
MKTYVFGAGASFHAHYPLASKLWPSVEGWVRKEPLAHIYRSAADNLNELFDTSKPFEMFLTELDDRISHTSDRSLVSLRNHAGGRATLTGKYNAGLSFNIDRNSWGCATSRAFREVACRTADTVRLRRHCACSSWSTC